MSLEAPPRAQIETPLLIKAWLIVLLARLGLAIFAFRGLARYWHAPATDATASEALSHHIGLHVALAARAAPKANCLVQALAAQFFLSRSGFASAIHIGVAELSEDGRFRAHAWLTSGDVIVVGGERAHIETYRHLAEMS